MHPEHYADIYEYKAAEIMQQRAAYSSITALYR